MNKRMHLGVDLQFYDMEGLLSISLRYKKEVARHNICLKKYVLTGMKNVESSNKVGPMPNNDVLMSIQTKNISQPSRLV